MTVAQLQATLGSFDMDAEVYFGYPAIDNYGTEHQERSSSITVEEVVDLRTGAYSPIIFINGAERLED